MDLLKTLVETSGVSGREQAVRDVIHAYVDEHCGFDDIRVDALGSLICIKAPTQRKQNNTKPVRVLIAAHMDQVGFLVAAILPGGYLSLHPVGAFDPKTLVASRVTVHTAQHGALAGVLQPTGRPIHTASENELQRVPQLDEFYVELGLEEKEVRDRVCTGDMVVLEGSFESLGHCVMGRALDNRIGCWALIRAIEQLDQHACEIVAVWSSQEEVGSRGIGPASFDIAPDIGIVCETVVCCDTPGVAVRDHVTRAGDGICLLVADSSTIACPELIADVAQVAQEKAILFQRATMLGGGQDGALIQRSRSGVRTVVLSCPLKYMHTHSEIAHRQDIESFRDLLCAYLTQL